MKTALTLIAALVLSGCAAPQISPWDGLTTETAPAATPIDCGKFPLPTEIVGDAIVYDNDGINALEVYRTCSEANEAIAGEHAQQIGHLKIARRSLVDAGRAQRNIADMRQEMLEDERRHRFWSSIGYWAVIIGMGSAL